MAEIDELDINPLFTALQTTFSSIYLKAQNDCLIICIPHSDSLAGAQITRKFVETHILRPSPYFKSKFMTLLTDKQCVSLDDTGEYLCTEDGFPDKVQSKILSEELGYNKDYKPYKILIIDKPLDETVLKKESRQNVTCSGEFTQKLTLKECQEFLRAYVEFAKPLKELEGEIHKFNHNYVLLKDFLDDAIQRLNTISVSAAESCLSKLPKSQSTSYKFSDAVNSAIETFTIGSVHNKLYPVICARHVQEDEMMVVKCRRLTGLTPDLLGVPEALCCPLPAAVVELATLDGLATPIEKLFCLKSTLDGLTKEIEVHIRKSEDPENPESDLPSLTPDDLIPILVTVIVQAKCRHVHSDIFYIENFYWAAGTKDRDNLSYCLVTFKAAVQYMMDTDFSHIDLDRNRADSEISLKDLLHKQRSQVPSLDYKTPSPAAADDSRPRSYSRNRYERQMENINKMLEETAMIGSSSNSKPAAPIVTSVFGGSVSIQTFDERVNKSETTKKEVLGDFLSNLQNDLGFSFGKQT